MKPTQIVIACIISLGQLFSTSHAQEGHLNLCGKDVHLSTLRLVHLSQEHTWSNPIYCTGTVIAVNRDTLRLRAEGWSEFLFISTSSIQTIEVCMRRENPMSSAAGFFLGATIGFVVGMAVDKPGNDVSSLQTGAVGALIGGVTGMSLSARFVASGREIWEPIPVERIGRCALQEKLNTIE